MNLDMKKAIDTAIEVFSDYASKHDNLRILQSAEEMFIPETDEARWKKGELVGCFGAHCHYWLGNENFILPRKHAKDRWLRTRENNLPTSWYIGMTLLRERLGVALDDWAKENPKLWGNKHGGKIFITRNAWGIGMYDDLNFSIIIEHLSGVRERLA